MIASKEDAWTIGVLFSHSGLMEIPSNPAIAAGEGGFIFRALEVRKRSLAGAYLEMTHVFSAERWTCAVR